MTTVPEVEIKAVVYEDGTRQVVPSAQPRPADLVAWERHFGRPATSMAAVPRSEDGVPLIALEEALYLVWLQIRRGTGMPDGFDEWLDRVAELETGAVALVEAPVPSDPDPLG